MEAMNLRESKGSGEYMGRVGEREEKGKII